VEAAEVVGFVLVDVDVVDPGGEFDPEEAGQESELQKNTSQRDENRML
jgi:hypothetical protein